MPTIRHCSEPDLARPPADGWALQGDENRQRRTAGPFYDLDNAGGKYRTVSVTTLELPQRYAYMRKCSDKRFREKGGAGFMGLFVSTSPKVGPGQYVQHGDWLSGSNSIPGVKCDDRRLYSPMHARSCERFRFKGGENFGLFVGTPANTGPDTHSPHEEWLRKNSLRDKHSRYALMRDCSDRRFRGKGGECYGLYVSTPDNLGPGNYIQHGEWIKDETDKGTLEIDPWCLVKNKEQAALLGASL